VYPVLQSVYEHVISAFAFPDLFHIGGDEVSWVHCVMQ
jgi:hypothetical protein